MNSQFTKIHPFRLFLGLLAIIFISELAIMFVLDRALSSSRPQWLEASIDAGLLTALCVPFFWRFFLSPLQSALEQEGVKAQVAMEMAAEGIIVLDEIGIVQAFNRAAEQMFGYREDEVKGKSLLRLLSLPDGGQPEQYDLVHYLGMHDVDLREAQGIRKDGTAFPVEMAVGELKLAGGRQFTAIVRDITARKQAQKQLELANEQLTSIFAHIHGLIAYLDTRFNFIRVNQAYAEADQQTPEYFVGKNHFVVFPDADNEAIFRRVLESGEPYRVAAKPFEYAGHPERGVSYWDWGLYPVKGAAGEVHGLLLFLNDVTERQRASMALQENEERYRVLFDHSGDAIIFLKTTPEGRQLVAEANEVACQRLGYRHSELVGMDVTSFNVPGYPRNRDEVVRQIRQHGQALFETMHLAKDGRQIPVEVHARAFQFRGEAVTLAIVRDITERKQAEKDKEELRRNLQALLNAIQESTFLMERQGRMLIVNEVGAQRLKTTPEQLVGKNVYEMLPPDLARTRRERFEQIAQRGMPDTYEDERAGRRFLSSIYPIRDASGEVARFAVYAVDVTQQRRLQGVEELFPEINQLVLQGLPLPAVLIFICNKVTELFNFAVAWVGRKEPDGSISVLAGGGGAAAKYVDQLKQIGVRWDDTPQGRGPAGSAIRVGRPQALRVADPRFQAWAKAALENDLQVMLGIPLVIRGEIYGVFTLYSSDPDFFDAPAVVTMLTGIATRISVAIEAAMDQQQIRLLSSALESAGNGVMITNVRGNIQWVNPAFARLSGYSKAELIGQNPLILADSTGRCNKLAKSFSRCFIV